MGIGRKLLLLPLLILPAAAFISCGGNPTPPVTNSYTGLTGNWGIMGDRASSTYPMAALALVQSGTQLVASGEVVAPCGYLLNPLSMLVTIPVQLTGTVAVDGSFTLVPMTLPVPTQLAQLSIQGKSSATGWGGSYTLTGSAAPSGCVVSNSSGNFTAQAITPVTGNYSGTAPMSAILGGTSYNAIFSAQLTQSSSPSGLSTLSGSLAVQGLPCFTHSTAMGTTSLLAGDIYVATFTMDDGSSLMMAGNLTDFASAGLDGEFIVNGGNCNNMFGRGTLVRH
ncbi:MAG: hypothetical protein P4L10_10285 [Acidobacteriaceae bacterium]|jgi:hypothetical protein|nr:hypothetical protein [Acidobacteriaceae bacterium]